MRNQNGQIFIFAIALCCVFLVIIGIMFRSGKSFIVQHRYQQYCNLKALESLRPIAQAIKSTSYLNPAARSIIESRRAVDKALKKAKHPAVIAALVAIRIKLVAMQNQIAFQQKSLARLATLDAKAKLEYRNPELSKNMSMKFSPSNAGLEQNHGPSFLSLHLKNESSYAKETGSPKELDSDFQSRQRVDIDFLVDLEPQIPKANYINQNRKIAPFKKMKPIKVQCAAQIFMRTINDQFKIELAESKYRR